MKKLDKKTEQFLLRNLCTRMKKYKNSLFLFIFFVCRVTNVEQNLKEMNFCCWNSWFPFSSCFFVIIHWLWNSWFPFSSCFSSSYIDFEIHDFLFLSAFLSYIDFEIHDFLAWRQNITISGISKMWCFFSKVQKSQEI